MIGGALNTDRGILDLVLKSGGSVETRIRLQKMAFLAKLRGAADFGGLKFSYHHYGPYSRELSDTLRDLVSSGLIEEDVSDIAEGKKYLYRATSTGRAWFERAGKADEIIESTVAASITHNWRTLELASTIAFLERRDNSPRNIAVERSLQLKPKCAGYRAEALGLLDQLSL